MKEITLVLVACAWLLFSCKNNDETITSVISDDANIVHDVMTKNLLFNKTYTLVDSVSSLLIFGVNRSLAEQDLVIEKLIQSDSIPNHSYKINNEISNNWSSTETYSVLTNKKCDEIFKDPYILSGKIDNYKILKEKTGAAGIIYISNIYYSSDTVHAIIGVTMHCGWHCGQSQIRYYKKENSQWKMEMKYIMSES